MRELMMIPIIHAASDLGNLQAPIEQLKLESVSSELLKRSRKSVDYFWESLQLAFQNWRFDFPNLLIFQDALPVGSSQGYPIEQKIVKELAEKGSANHQLIELLMQRGAHLMGTEQPELLMEEYRLVKQFLGLHLGGDPTSHAEEMKIATKQKEILVRRDHHIANRIDETLVPPKTGLIFLGMLHQLEKYLPTDIQVCYPFGKPSYKQ